MTRFFYTDPLAAAWMSKHFGMAYQEDTMCIDVVWSIELPNTDDKYLIHPDSLHLLEAREGDVCWEEGYGGDPDCGLPFDLVDPANHGPIILRNGIPFMWPEQE